MARLVTEIHGSVPGLTPSQGEEVARVLGEQWDAMAAMQQQARENGTYIARRELVRRAQEMADEKLYGILSPPQLEAFQRWRDTRFGSLHGIPR